MNYLRGAPTNQGSDTYAQDMNAWLNRQQWADYKDRFQPVERQLIDETMGQELLDERLSSISATADKSFDSAMLGADITRSRYGIDQGESQAQSELRKMMSAKTTTIADAKNNTRTHIYDRNIETLAGGSGTAGAAAR